MDDTRTHETEGTGVPPEPTLVPRSSAASGGSSDRAAQDATQDSSDAERIAQLERKVKHGRVVLGIIAIVLILIVVIAVVLSTTLINQLNRIAAVINPAESPVLIKSSQAGNYHI